MESQGSEASSARGTVPWLAPEILDPNRKLENQSLMPKRDIYAFACTVLEVNLSSLIIKSGFKLVFIDLLRKSAVSRRAARD
jgi:serine/threonine protein kinase